MLTIGMIVLILGISAMDSTSIVLPFGMMLTGFVLMYIGAFRNEK